MTTQQPPTVTPMLRVLGTIELMGPQGGIPLREGRPRRLLAALVVRSGVSIPVDELIEGLWSDDGRPADARNALQVQISYLRRQLGSLHPDVVLERQADAYVLRVRRPELVDSAAFERGVRAASDLSDSGRPEDWVIALAEIDGALGLWRGAPFADAAYDDMVQTEIVRLGELHATAREVRGRTLLQLGRAGEAVESLQVLATEQPLRESVWSALMLAMYRSRRQAEALRVYASAREHLVDALGLEPGAELRALEQRVLNQDPTLDWVPPVRLAGSVDEPAPSIAGTLAAALPPLRSRVPVEVSTLVGRAFETDHVDALLGEHRLVTLTGPGGVGKTRLAVAVAGRRQVAAPTCVIELGSVQPGADLALVLANGVGVPAEPGADPLDSVAARLGDGSATIVLDTCEHVLDAVALMASRLLRRTTALRILATSRRPLGVSGEVVWPVPALEVAETGAGTMATAGAADAVRLFVERASAVRPGFVLDDANAADIARICRTLDGLPLAIELAAARVNVLSPARIAERLVDGLSLLSREGPEVDPRQRSLRATIEWSYDLLDDAPQRFFDRLSVIGGAFELDAAAAIGGAGLDADPLELISALVDRSMLRSVDDDRFSMLDSLRTFARTRLEAHGPDAVGGARARHAAWYSELALAADPYSHGPLPDHWSRLRADAENCVRAVEWLDEQQDRTRAARIVGALAGFWLLDGQITRAEWWLGRFAEVDADDTTRAVVLRGVGVLELYQSRFAASVVAGRRSVDHARRTGDGELVASTLLTYGSALWGTGELQASLAALDEATATFARHHDLRGEGFATARMGRTLDALGDDRALLLLERATELLGESRDRWMSCVALEHLANAQLRSGAAPAAIDTARRAVDIGAESGSHAGRLFALATLGRALLAAGRADDALQVALGALTVSAEIGNPGSIADSLDACAAALDRLDVADPVAAALTGLADEVRERRAVSIPATAVGARARMVDEVAAHVGRATFDELARSGRTRTIEWAIERVRRLVD